MAISAVLMLSTGIAHAQDMLQQTTVAPPPVVSTPAISQPATPTIVLPQVAPQIVPEPEMAASPLAAPSPPAEVSRASQAQPLAARSVAAARSATAPSAPVESESRAVTPATPVASSAGLPASADGAARTAPASTGGEDIASWALPVGAAATLLVLGGVAFAATRRRRAWEADAEFIPPVATRSTARPATHRANDIARPTTASGAYAAAMHGELADREQLVEHMVNAAPDAANPFTSRKARRRRAKLILASIARRAPAPQHLDMAPARTGYAERPLQDHRVLATL